MSLSWVACEATTGRVIERLPGLECNQVGVTLCRYESAQGIVLPLASAPVGWERAIMPGATFLVLTDGPDVALWGGLITKAPRDHTDRIALTVPSIEAYAAMRDVGDETYTGVGQNAIIEDLATKYLATGPNGGIPLTVVKVDGDGAPQDRTYEASAKQSVFSQMQELAAIEGGPEWTIKFEHLTDPERYCPVLYVGTRIGTSPAAGLAPAAVFTMPGNLVSVRQENSFERGKGANTVTAWSSGQDGSRPVQSFTVADLDRPTIEHSFSPAANITEDATLLSHARRKAESMARGQRSLTLVADYAKAPRLGSQWSIGDDVAYRIGGRRDGVTTTLDADTFADVFTDEYGTPGVVHGVGARETVPAFPGGLSGTARALGWRLTLGGNPTIAPVLAGSEES